MDPEPLIAFFERPKYRDALEIDTELGLYEKETTPFVEKQFWDAIQPSKHSLASQGYIVEDVIGKGPFSVVFRIHKEKDLAIKFSKFESEEGLSLENEILTELDEYSQAKQEEMLVKPIPTKTFYYKGSGEGDFNIHISVMEFQPYTMKDAIQGAANFSFLLKHWITIEPENNHARSHYVALESIFSTLSFRIFRLIFTLEILQQDLEFVHGNLKLSNIFFGESDEKYVNMFISDMMFSRTKSYPEYPFQPSHDFRFFFVQVWKQFDSIFDWSKKGSYWGFLNWWMDLILKAIEPFDMDYLRKNSLETIRKESMKLSSEMEPHELLTHPFFACLKH